jgi:hypothetical protein
MLLIVLWACGAPAFAQFDLTFLTTEWDSNYYNRFATHWSVRLFSVSKNQTFSVLGKSDSARLNFRPNSKAAIGVGISYGTYALDIGFSVSNSREDSVNASESFDFMSGLYSGQHAFDLNFQHYAGFFSNFEHAATDTVFRNDIRTFTLGVNYNYNFNYGRYSLNAPFIGTEIQKKTAGTPLAGAFFYYYDLRSNETLIPAAGDSVFNEYAHFTEANLFSMGLMGGYAFTLVLPAHFFITASLIPGISFNLGDAKTGEYYNIGHPLTISPKLVSRNSIGYSSRKFYALLSYYFDGNTVNMGNKNQLNYDLSKLKLLMGYRID